ncbi:hypothetical protein MASR2M39_29970 [Ignavibacteriales bacterium]
MAGSSNEGCAWAIGGAFVLATIYFVLGFLIYNLSVLGYYTFYSLDKLFFISEKIPAVASYGLLGSVYGFLATIIVIVWRDKLPKQIIAIASSILVILTLLLIIV